MAESIAAPTFWAECHDQRKHSCQHFSGSDAGALWVTLRVLLSVAPCLSEFQLLIGEWVNEHVNDTLLLPASTSDMARAGEQTSHGTDKLDAWAGAKWLKPLCSWQKSGQFHVWHEGPALPLSWSQLYLYCHGHTHTCTHTLAPSSAAVELQFLIFGGVLPPKKANLQIFPELDMDLCVPHKRTRTLSRHSPKYNIYEDVI